MIIRVKKEKKNSAAPIEAMSPEQKYAMMNDKRWHI